ncbi:hypothetical protein BpHYR1_051439 [Brachionus plicatilis]|uniref:Uncharacterized protein n=1 Tax=Brachionus plicatilis TaxID=10195 RepID=A0A3M7SHM1_BRAPC|nr:hypothetical protein BpHYR1_051439 [Brachionus plicatilis]
MITNISMSMIKKQNMFLLLRNLKANNLLNMKMLYICTVVIICIEMLLWFCLSIFPTVFGKWINSNDQLCSKSSELARLDDSSNLIFKNFNSFQRINFFCFNLSGFNSSFLLFKDLNERFTQVEVYFYRSKLDKGCHQCPLISKKGLFDGISLVEFAFTVKYSLNTCPYIFRNSSIYELKFHGLSKSAIRFNQLSFDASFTNEQVNASVNELVFYCYKGTLTKRIEWIKRINENLRINFSNKSDIINNMDKVTIISFQDYKINRQTDLDWLDDKYFCIFKDFPENNLVIPTISSQYSSNCTCLMIWLFNQTRIILKHVRIPQVRILNSCSNGTWVEIMIKGCNFDKIKNLCSVSKQLVPEKASELILF